MSNCTHGVRRDKDCRWCATGTEPAKPGTTDPVAAQIEIARREIADLRGQLTAAEKREALLRAALKKRSGYDPFKEQRLGVAGAEGTGYLVYQTWRCCGSQLERVELNGRVTERHVHECDVTRALALPASGGPGSAAAGDVHGDQRSEPDNR